MTLNLWNLEGDWRSRRVEVVAWLRRLEPDVVCLQEIVEAPDGRNQARWLADAVGGYQVAFAGRDAGNGNQFGNAVLSRWPIDAVGDADLPSTLVEGEIQRLVVHARTRGIDAFSTHLNFRFADGAVREGQVQALAGFVNETAAGPVVIGGDFNAEPGSTEMRFLCGLTSLGGRSVYFHDAWRVAGGGGPGLTWDNRNSFAAAEREPDRRIDYVLSTAPVDAARVVCDRSLTGTFASDHFGLLAEISDPI